jgi:hypothetical protein
VSVKVLLDFEHISKEEEIKGKKGNIEKKDPALP